MNCQEVRELMERHVDGDLNAAETQALMNHVAYCPDCAAMLERLIRLTRGLEQLPKVEPPYSLVDAILPKLGLADADSSGTPKPEETAAPAYIPRSRRTGGFSRSWLARVSGVAALGIAVGLLLVNGPFSKHFNNQQDAAVAQESGSVDAEMTNKLKAGNIEVHDQYGAIMSSPEPMQAPKLESDRSPSAGNEGAEPSARESGGGFERNGGDNAGAGPGVAPSDDAPVTGLSAPEAPDPTKSADNRGKSATPPPETEGEGFASDPKTPESDPPFSFMGQPSVYEEEAVSPDGRWRAVLIEGRLQIFRESDGALVYDPAPDEGVRSGLAWSEDSVSLNYTYTGPDGEQMPMSLMIDLSSFQEITR